MFKSNFQAIDSVKEVNIYDSESQAANLISKIANSYDTLGYSSYGLYTGKIYGKDNYQNHVHPSLTPLNKGALNKIDSIEYYKDGSSYVEGRTLTTRMYMMMQEI